MMADPHVVAEYDQARAGALELVNSQQPGDLLMVALVRAEKSEGAIVGAIVTCCLHEPLETDMELLRWTARALAFIHASVGGRLHSVLERIRDEEAA
jgi:hypothetical protein